VRVDEGLAPGLKSLQIAFACRKDPILIILKLDPIDEGEAGYGVYPLLSVQTES